MVSDPVKEYLLEASAYYKQAEQLGKDDRVIGFCKACEGTLQSINVFVHDDESWEEINKKTKELEQMFVKEFNKKATEMKDLGTWRNYNQWKKIEQDMYLWKAQQKLSFYDYLTKKYDI
jgi:hypothetical protein